MPQTRQSKLSLSRKTKQNSTAMSSSQNALESPSLTLPANEDGAKTAHGTHGVSSQSLLHDELRNILETDENLTKSISDAVAKVITEKFVTTPALLNTITKDICKDKNFIQTIATKLSESVKQEVYKSISHDVAVVKTKAETNEQTNQKLTKKFQQQYEKIDDLEQYSRRNCLLIHGIPESTMESTDELVINTINSKLEVPLAPDHLDRTHRLGKKTKPADASADGPQPRPRPIIVKFISYSKRSEVFRAKRRLKGSSILISENLTANRMDLLRRAKLADSVTAVWSTDGKIICLLTSGRRFVVSNSKDLDKL